MTCSCKTLSTANRIILIFTLVPLPNQSATMGNIILQGLTQEELEQMIQSKLEQQFAKLSKELTSKSDSEELLTREETCEFLKINSSTLWHWTNKGKVKAYAIGSRRFYKRSELLQSIKPVQQ